MDLSGDDQDGRFKLTVNYGPNIRKVATTDFVGYVQAALMYSIARLDLTYPAGGGH